MVCERLCEDNNVVAGDATNKTDNGEKTTLTLAEYLPCCISCTQREENVGSKDDDGVTALMHAVRNDHKECAQVLISQGANVNIRDNGGKTALMYTVRHDNINIFRLLTDSHADVDIQDDAGKTALMYAGEMGSTCVCQLLIDNKCNVNLQDNTGKTALINAITAKMATMHVLCGSSADVNVQDKNGMTALMHAARNGSEMCGALVNRKADLNLRDDNGMTALMHAACMFHLKTCELLLKKNADVAVRDNEGMPALMHVICKILRYPTLYSDKVTDALNIAERLICHGADIIFDGGHDSLLQMIESRTRCGLTLRHLIIQGKSGLVRLLISNGIMDAEIIDPTPGQMPFRSVVECAASFRRHDLLTFMFDKCYLTQNDLSYIRRAFAETLSDQTGKCGTKHYELSRETADLKAVCETRRVLQQAANQVWPLSKLAFITVSSALGASPERNERIARTPLPPIIKRALMFQQLW